MDLRTKAILRGLDPVSVFFLQSLSLFFQVKVELQTEEEANSKLVKELSPNDIDHRENYDVFCKGCRELYSFAGQVQIHLSESNEKNKSV